MQLGPETVGHIFQLLSNAQSSQPRTQKDSETALSQLEAREGFCSCLAEIIQNKQADHSARWLASIYLKNKISKSWKSRHGVGCLSEGEKAYLRGKLLHLLNQENNQIAIPLAVAFAKVARADYPAYWSSLFQDLINLVNANDTLTTRRVFLTLHHILKELASMRLPSSQRNFAQVTKMLYKLYWSQWCQDTQELVSGLAEALAHPHQTSPLAVTFERWFLELKGLQRMILYSAQSDAKTLVLVEAVTEVVPASLQTLQAFQSMRPSGITMRAQLHAMLDRALIKLAKLLRDTQEMHPWSFYHSGCFQQSLEYFTKLLSQPPAQAPSYEKFLMQAMIFLHNVRQCKAYRGAPETTMESKLQAGEQLARVKRLGEAAQKELLSFWMSGKAHSLCQELVWRYFPLSTKEIQEWAEDSEEFSQQTGQGIWQDNLRTCAETLFASLIGIDRDSMASVCLQMLQSTSEACPTGRSSSIGGPRREGIPEAVLAKEAAYNAVGVGSWDLLDHLDFTSWLQSSLLPELADASPEHKPLRRRVAILIGQWVPQLKGEDRPTVYRALLDLLADEDFGVSMAGVAAFQDLVDDWAFTEDQFIDFVSPCFQLLALRLQASREYETQIQIFNLLNAILERLADSVKPFLGLIIQIVPSLWDQSSGQTLLRMQILATVQRIVNCLGPECTTMYPLVLPILQQCTNFGECSDMSLLEDGFQLWLVTLRNAPQPDPQLLGFFPTLAHAMSQSTEHIQIAAQIMVSCSLLGGRDLFLVPYGQQLALLLQQLIGNLTERGMHLLIPVMNVVLQVIPEEGPALLEPTIRALLEDVFSSKEPTTVVAASMSVFARLLFQSSSWFYRIFQSAKDMDGRSACEAFVELWLERFDSIPSLGARKLSALALCRLLASPMAWIQSHLTAIVTNITSVWFETEASEPSIPSAGHAISYPSPFRASDVNHGVSISVVFSEEAEGESRRTKLILHDRDPAVSSKLSDVLRESMNVASQLPESRTLSNILSTLDPMLASQLQTMLAS